jgi:prephenate dehydrogenase
LIGGSVALAARRTWPDITILGFDDEPSVAADAARRRIVDGGVQHLADLDGSDLLILATPVAAVVGLLPVLAAFTHPCVITDVGSTKRDVMRAASESGLQSFVGGHPMAGGERGGLDHAAADLFTGRPWLLVSGDQKTEAARRVERFVASLGAVPQFLQADAHDRAIAFVSHLPQIVSVAIMNAAAESLDPSGLSTAGRAFDEMTRLASSPADLWEGILASNADYVAEALAAFLHHLPADQPHVDSEWVRQAFARAAAARGRTRERVPTR